MEILSNFASIYCYIAFVIGAVLMLVSLSIAAMGKDNEPRNPRSRVRFFVKALGNGTYRLYFKNKNGDNSLIGITEEFYLWGLNLDDFADMEEGEIREVFINLED